MPTLADIKSRLPEWAKDIRLNLDATIQRSSLEPRLAIGAALAAAYAARSPDLVEAFRDPATIDERHATAALTAAALMGMNNVWYPFVEMSGDVQLKTMRAELRMNAYATHGGADKVAFELYALAASIVGKCEFCVRSHAKGLTDAGLTTQQLRDVGRIAATVSAAALALAVAPQAETVAA
ncbi:MAG: carboxymuconolactone decarboxylase family protein [Betaproteobacteria bacterium]